MLVKNVFAETNKTLEPRIKSYKLLHWSRLDMKLRAEILVTFAKGNYEIVFYAFFYGNPKRFLMQTIENF